jgi:hypothetical protein
MIANMKYSISMKRVLPVALLLCAATGTAWAQDIYKCTQAGRIEYTDRPCPGPTGELIHKADDREIIDQYLDLGQNDAAKRYATSHNLDALYKERVDAYKQKMEERNQRAADEAAAAKQRDEEAQQQAVADEQIARRNRLQAENDALREQNDQYRDQLAQPVISYAPSYWAPPYRDRDHEHHHQPPGPPPQPISHPCRQLAGGRLEC